VRGAEARRARHGSGGGRGRRARGSGRSRSPPKCRDARGTAFVDQTARDIAYAWRTFRRAPLAALTIIATVALGLGLVTVVFTFYNAWYLQSDGVRDPDELFAIHRPPHRDASIHVWVAFTPADYRARRAETNAFTDITATLGATTTRIDGRADPSGRVSCTGVRPRAVGHAMAFDLLGGHDGPRMSPSWTSTSAS
jgi:hypothetical protein